MWHMVTSGRATMKTVLFGVIAHHLTRVLHMTCVGIVQNSEREVCGQQRLDSVSRNIRSWCCQIVCRYLLFFCSAAETGCIAVPCEATAR